MLKEDVRIKTPEQFQWRRSGVFIVNRVYWHAPIIQLLWGQNFGRLWVQYQPLNRWVDCVTT